MSEPLLDQERTSDLTDDQRRVIGEALAHLAAAEDASRKAEALLWSLVDDDEEAAV